MAAKPDPEVLAKGKRRSFTAEYKSRILAEADRCKHDGEIGALLRREGLYSSHLATWRAQRAEGGLASLGRKRGPKPTPIDPSAKRIAELEREVTKLRLRAEKAVCRSEWREQVKPVIEQAAKAVGTRAACDALGVSRASYHQRPGQLLPRLRRIVTGLPAGGARNAAQCAHGQKPTWGVPQWEHRPR